jgi:hypothetical protein
MKTLFFTFILSSTLWAQTPSIIDVDLSQFCEDLKKQDELEKENRPLCLKDSQSNPQEFEKLIEDLVKAGPLFDRSKVSRDVCLAIELMAYKKVKPIEYGLFVEEVKTSGDLIPKVKEKWKLRFNFGFARTTYFDTDMLLKSDRVDVIVRDFSFDERTTSSFYNPKNWEQPMDAFRWIDEPSNQFIVTAEKNKNVIYLTIFHPKYLKKNVQVKHITGTVDGVEVDKVMPLDEQFDGYNRQLGEMYLTRFENTHKQMTWQIGYGRRFTLYKSPDQKTEVRWTPHVHAGIMTGEHFTVYEKKDQYWEFDDYLDTKNPVQGAVFSVGHSLEVQRGKVSLFVDQKYNYSHVKHGFGSEGGTAEYDFRFMPITFGIGIDLFNPNKKK